MDPNETLRELRELMKKPIIQTVEEMNDWIADVSERFYDLDEDLTRGTALPDAWERSARATMEEYEAPYEHPDL